MITVEIAYAKNATEQELISLQIPADSTVATAIQNSGILQKFPEINLQVNKIGIYSKLVSLTDMLSMGDRIEIYRPLIIDPKQARLLRAKRKNITICHPVRIHGNLITSLSLRGQRPKQ